MEQIITQASTFAESIDTVIWIIALLGGFWLIVAEAILFYLIFKYRRKNHPKAAYIAGESATEKKWIHWPHYLVILCDIVIIGFSIKVWYDVKQTLPTPDHTIRIIGQQWAWTFVHPGPDHQLDTPDDILTIDELHVQNHATYHFKLESRDVIHSFSVPVFRLKQDAVPGRTITGWFRPTKMGTFDIQCAEMCGIGHGIMGARIFIESPEEHALWIQSNSPVNHITQQME